MTSVAEQKVEAIQALKFAYYTRRYHGGPGRLLCYAQDSR